MTEQRPDPSIPFTLRPLAAKVNFGPDGKIQSIEGDPDAIAKVSQIVSGKAENNPSTPPPPQRPSVAIRHRDIQTATVEPPKQAEQTQSAPKVVDQTVEDSDDETGPTTPDVQAVNVVRPREPWRRRWRTWYEARRQHEQEMERRNKWKYRSQGIAGAAIASIVVFAIASAYYNAKNAVLPQTVPAGQCLDQVPAGSLIASSDYTLDNGPEQVDGNDTVTFILFTRPGKFCADNSNSVAQVVNDTDIGRLSSLAHAYEARFRQGGRSNFITITH